MRVIKICRVACFSLLALSVTAPAQVLSPQEIRDPEMQALQQKYLPELKAFTQAMSSHRFPYHFYFSRTLDLAEKEQQSSDQRSVQFDRFEGKVVLKITGNYFASYSTNLMSPGDRARQTFQDVMLPLLQAAVPALANADEIESFALEISHHVRKPILGVSSEGVENVVLIVPKVSAERVAQATSAATQEVALGDAEAFLNAVPISLWLHQEPVMAKGNEMPVVKAVSPGLAPGLLKGVSSFPYSAKAAVVPPVVEPAKSTSDPGIRDTSPDALKDIQKLYQTSLDRMVQEINPQAHFVRYAPPAFIPFHKGIYLQLSTTTTLAGVGGGSQYKLAALAFDQHIAHLIRPALSYLKEDSGDFDGIDFSTSVRLDADTAGEGGSVAVEFIFPLKLLRAYEQFDCTGQQLIDGSFVLINGERVSLNLQAAEAGS
jgi:hypothetical protein